MRAGLPGGRPEEQHAKVDCMRASGHLLPHLVAILEVWCLSSYSWKEDYCFSGSKKQPVWSFLIVLTNYQHNVNFKD